MTSNTYVGAFASVASAITALFLLPPFIFSLEGSERLIFFVSGSLALLVLSAMAWQCGRAKGLAACGRTLVVSIALNGLFFVVLRDAEKKMGTETAFVLAMALAPMAVLVIAISAAEENRPGLFGRLLNVVIATGVLIAVAKLTGGNL